MPAREYTRRFRGSSFTSTRESHDDLTVAVTRLGGARRDGRAFVLVHGIGVSSRMFRPVALRLTEHGSVHLVDLPGYGFAPDPRRPVTLADHADVVATFIRESRFDEVVLVGHSMGSQVVTLLTQRHPGLVDRIVLIAPTIEPERRTVVRAIGGLVRDAFREPLVVSWIAFTDYVFRCGLPYLSAQFPVLLRDALDERIADVPASILVIRGADDVVVSHAWCERLATRGDARLVEVPGPHSVMYTDPETVVAEIVEHASSTAGS